MSGFAGHEINPDGAGPTLFAVGKLIVNFGAIEWQTYVWIRRMRGVGPEYDSALGRMFAGRVEIVEKLVAAAPIDATLRTECLAAWTDARGLATLRNKIAHSPVALVWRNRDAVGPPDGLAILDAKSATGPNRSKHEVLALATLSQAVDQAVGLATRLEALCERLPLAPSL